MAHRSFRLVCTNAPGYTPPLEGTYILHPNQIQVHHPSNVEDEEIPTGLTFITEESYKKPLSTPTSISYFLQRLQVATISREVTDLLTPTFCTSPEIDNSDEMYAKILLLDQKYQQLLKSLPPFFQLTNRMDPNAYDTLTKEKPYLEPQRYLLAFVIHTNLARLHRRFLIRGSTQPKFAYSRMQCIQSAETVLEVRNLVIGNGSVGSFTNIFLAHFFMAAVILAMDVCFNPNEIRVEQRKQDVFRACRVLEEDLSAKMEPASDLGNGGGSNGHRMLRAFQTAVRNLRGLLRNTNSKDKLLQVEAASGTTHITHEFGDQSINRMNFSSERQESAQKRAMNSENYATQSEKYSTNLDSTPQEQQTTLPPPPYDEFQPSGEFAVDDMWQEFFTVGPDFNSTDWDSFLIDLDEQMAGMGSST